MKLGETSFLLCNLKDRKDLRSSFYQFIDAYFPKGSGDFGALNAEAQFPLLLNSDNSKRVFVLIGEGQIVASCAYTLFEIPSFSEADSNHSKIAGIGLVITHPNFRGRGLSRRLMFECEKQARSEGACLSLLWSDLYDFYSKLGYCLGGQELQWNIKVRPNLEAPTKVKLIKNFEAIQGLYPFCTFFPKRNWDHYQKYLELKNLDLAIIEDGATTLAYIIVGKGRDLQNCIHEHGGNFNDVVKLINAYQSSKKQELRLQCSPFDSAQELFKNEFGEPEQSALSFVKIINLFSVIKILNSIALKDSDIRISADVNGKITILREKALLFESLNPEHLVQLFMSPFPIQELQGIDEKLQSALKGIKGLPFYFWGLDSV